MNKRIGIVILNFNTYNETLECISSFDEKEKSLDNHSFFIVDNGSRDGSGKQLKEYFAKREDITVLLSDKNLGFSGGNNIGIKAAISDGCEYVFVLNSDIVLQNDAISKMVQFFDEHEDVAYIGPRVVDIEGKDSQIAGKALNLKGYLFFRKPLSSLFKSKSEEYTMYHYDREKDFIFSGCVHGCCFGLKRDFILSGKVLDDNIFLYCEENVLAHQAENLGLKTAICASSHVLHKEASSLSSTGYEKLLFYRMYAWNSALYMLRKYANASRFACKLISFIDICFWAMYSIKSAAYRKSFKAFLAEKKRIKKLAE